jgi:hypothetical protein
MCQGIVLQDGLSDFNSIQPEFSRLLRFFNTAKMNQSDTGISDIDQSPSSVLKKRSKRENSGCTIQFDLKALYGLFFIEIIQFQQPVPP